MVSQIKVNEIIKQSGSSISIGESGDTLSLTGTTNITGNTAITGTLSSTGTSFCGLSAASMWRVTANFVGTAATIASNWEAADSYGAANLGSAMTESSGIFTFPSTGFWLINFHMAFYANNGTQSAYGEIYTTTDNASYTGVTQAGAFSDVSLQQVTSIQFLFDVTSTTNCKVKFGVLQGNTSNTTQGSTDMNKTCASFLKLGET